MRNFEEFKEELLRRKDRRVAKDRRKRRVIVSVCLVLCVSIVAGLFLWPTTQVQALDLMRNIQPQWVSGKEPDETFRQAQLSFALELYRSCRRADGENVLVSPLSVMLALSMTANGAGGETLAQMEAVLGLPIGELNAYLKTYVNQLPSGWRNKLHIANSIWFREGVDVNRDFLQTNANYYGADAYATPMDAQTLKDINTWVDENTDGMIDKIMSELPPNALTCLVNAIYFDAGWAGKKPKDTKINFYLGDGTYQKLPALDTTAQYTLSMDNAIGFMKDYVGGKYRFVALLPLGCTLDAFLDEITWEELSLVLESAQESTVSVKFPEFSYDYSKDLTDVLKQMGITDAFDGGLANFSDMSDVSTYISDVFHKTHIGVDTEGTKAAAATSVTNSNKGGVDYDGIELNRPFLYMIVDSEHNLPLFIGTLDRVI